MHKGKVAGDAVVASGYAPPARLLFGVRMFSPAMNHLLLAVLTAFPLLSFAQTNAPAPSGDAPTIAVERHAAITGQGYFPVAIRLHDGRIAVVMRGGAGHLGLAGRLDMIFSSDEGKTWSKPVVVNDSPIDDRNPALGVAKDGTLVVGFWRTATYDDAGKYSPKLTTKNAAPGSRGQRMAARHGRSRRGST
jgi:hypothetical protein